MASGVRGIWAIDIGSNALKAIRLRQGSDGLEVIGFDYIEYGRILTSEDVTEDEQEEAIEKALHKFVEKNEIDKDEVAISVAGHNSFSRFIKLPPVEQKRIPEIVQYEAVQQIPFDINEVEWDWQLMENPDSADTEVGIFAIKNEVVSSILSNFSREHMTVSLVQVGPMALYNYAYYDRKEISEATSKATVILDMGTENTTLVVCDKNTVWQRSIRIGGNAFTEAIAEAFKLSFKKAEKLKRTAPMSKYMRQIFTAMKPVYTDLGSEIQRSLGFYTSSGPGREKGFSKIVALGGGMKLQGVAKYLQQTLNIPVIKPDSYERLTLAPEVSAAKFHDNIVDFGIVYGLGAQLLGDPKIGVNLLPKKIARAMAWQQKAKYFTMAAGLLLLVSLMSLVSVLVAKSQYKGQQPVRKENERILREANSAASKLSEQINRSGPFDEALKKEYAKYSLRETIPLLNKTLLSCLPNKTNNPDQAALYEAFEKEDVETVMSIPRPERKQIFITGLSLSYSSDLEKADINIERQKNTRFNMPQGPSGMEEDPFFEEDLGFYDARSNLGAGAGAAPKEDETIKGFVILIEGYSPYKKIEELLDPPGVLQSKDQSEWGIITRLENLSKVIPGTEFSLYKKNEIKHFSLENEEVDLNSAKTPVGIGIQKEIERISLPEEDTKSAFTPNYRRRPYIQGMGRKAPEKIYTEEVLVDPMTGEEISKVYDIITQADIDANPDYTENDLGKVKTDRFGEAKFKSRDNWFRIKVKIQWNRNVPVTKTPTNSRAQNPDIPNM